MYVSTEKTDSQRFNKTILLLLIIMSATIFWCCHHYVKYVNELTSARNPNVKTGCSTRKYSSDIKYKNSYVCVVSFRFLASNSSNRTASAAQLVPIDVMRARMRRLFILYSYSVTSADQFTQPWSITSIGLIDLSIFPAVTAHGTKQSSPLTRRVKLSVNVTSLPVTCRRFSHVPLLGECCREIYRLSPNECRPPHFQRMRSISLRMRFVNVHVKLTSSASSSCCSLCGDVNMTFLSKLIPRPRFFTQRRMVWHNAAKQNAPAVNRYKNGTKAKFGKSV